MITKFSSMFVFLVGMFLMTPFAILHSVLRKSADALEWVIEKACRPFDRLVDWLERH